MDKQTFVSIPLGNETTEKCPIQILKWENLNEKPIGTKMIQNSNQKNNRKMSMTFYTILILTGVFNIYYWIYNLIQKCEGNTCNNFTLQDLIGHLTNVVLNILVIMNSGNRIHKIKNTMTITGN